MIACWALATALVAVVNGVTSRLYLAIAMTTVVFAFVLSLVRLRHPRADGYIPTYHVIGIAIAFGGANIGFSPQLITPILGVVFMIACTLAIDHPRRLLPLAAGCVAAILPFVLELLQVLPPSLIRRGDELCAAPRMSAMRETALLGFVLSIAAVVVGCLYALRFRTALTEMHRRDAIHAWQLRQLLPKVQRVG